ncbi:hypothetical protein TALC_00775 [Thermoplasmatales archaeon BRNA1]|nr:hypothetical protein TALC_00775 [Thermoplasmatales archaeon BRNA1]
MFAKANEVARNFTRPIIISTRTLDGKTDAAVATMFIINSEGWAFTAGHVFDSFHKFQGDQNKIKEAEEINAKRPDNPIQKDPKWITNHSFWFGQDGVRMSKVYVNRQVDLALLKLEGIPPLSNYPVFRDPESIVPGTSLCRLGFPFVKAATEYNETTNAFTIKNGVLPLPFFPNDGIHTRNISSGMSNDGLERFYVETSTPGLKGQSGGPIFDSRGRICAMQQGTNSISLDFHPVQEYDGQSVIEHQFMNVGVGVHCKVLIQAMKKMGVKYDLDASDSGEQYIIH